MADPTPAAAPAAPPPKSRKKLLLVIAAGLAREPAPLPAVASIAEPAVMSAAALLFFVYLGFEEVANLVEEVRKPSRDLPLALFVSIAVTTILYVLVALAVVSMASPSALAGSDAPLVTAITPTLAQQDDAAEFEYGLELLLDGFADAMTRAGRTV